jgi:hypothetical protein
VVFDSPVGIPSTIGVRASVRATAAGIPILQVGSPSFWPQVGVAGIIGRVSPSSVPLATLSSINAANRVHMSPCCTSSAVGSAMRPQSDFVAT